MLSGSAPLSPHPAPIGDEIARCFRQSDLLSIATRLDAEVVGNHGIHLDRDARWAVVTGMLNLSHDDVKTAKRAHCKITFGPEWRLQLPVVHCREPWIRHDWDWHAGKGGLLCYILDEQWKDCVGLVFEQEGNAAAALYAASLCVRNVRWLLYRHHIAHVTGIKKWPMEWPAWPHGDTGRREYFRGKNDDE